MALKIETFSNQTGGASLFKAISHPLAVPAARALIAKLAASGPVALYDPFGFSASFAEIYPLDRVNIAGIYVQKIEAHNEAVRKEAPPDQLLEWMPADGWGGIRFRSLHFVHTM